MFKSDLDVDCAKNSAAPDEIPVSGTQQVRISNAISSRQKRGKRESV